MQISINTPALLFPAITLLMLAYTNRFLALASPPQRTRTTVPGSLLVGYTAVHPIGRCGAVKA